MGYSYEEKDITTSAHMGGLGASTSFIDRGMAAANTPKRHRPIVLMSSSNTAYRGASIIRPR